MASTKSQSVNPPAPAPASSAQNLNRFQKRKRNSMLHAKQICCEYDHMYQVDGLRPEVIYTRLAKKHNMEADSIKMKRWRFLQLSEEERKTLGI